MCYPPSSYIIFSLRTLKFYGDRGPGVGSRITQAPVINYYLERGNDKVLIFYLNSFNIFQYYSVSTVHCLEHFVELQLQLHTELRIVVRNPQCFQQVKFIIF